MLPIAGTRALRLFRVMGTPVYADFGLALLFVLILASPGRQGVAGFVDGLIFGLVVVVSVLLHELGHAWAIRRRGYGGSSITLGAFGGVTRWGGNPAYRDRIHISLAGPLVNLALSGISFGAIYGLRALAVSTPGWIDSILYNMAMANAFWGVYNLLPIHPMDGGQVARAVLTRRWGGRGLRRSLILSAAVAAIIALWALQSGMTILFVLLALTLYQNWVEWQRVQA